MYICTRLSTFFVSPSSTPHCQRNSYIRLFFGTLYTHILPHTYIRIRVSLLRCQSSLAHKIIHISIMPKLNYSNARNLRLHRHDFHRRNVIPFEFISSINIWINKKRERKKRKTDDR